MDYKIKYLKYKNKYLNLKGGSNIEKHIYEDKYEDKYKEEYEDKLYCKSLNNNIKICTNKLIEQPIKNKEFKIIYVKKEGDEEEEGIKDGFYTITIKNIINRNIYTLQSNRFQFIDISNEDFFNTLKEKLLELKNKNTLNHFLKNAENTKPYKNFFIQLYYDKFIDLLVNNFLKKNLKEFIFIPISSGISYRKAGLFASSPHTDLRLRNNDSVEGINIDFYNIRINKEMIEEKMFPRKIDDIKRLIDEYPYRFTIINIWILIDCTNQILKNNNMAFALIDESLDKIHFNDTTQIDIKASAHNTLKNTWVSRFDLKPGQGYMWESGHIPHYSYKSQDTTELEDNSRFSMEIRLFVEKLRE